MAYAHQPPTVAILGGGRFGRAVATALAHQGVPLRLWTRRPEVARDMQRACGACAQATQRPQDAVSEASVTILAVPLMGLREVAAALGEVAEADHVVLHAVRGAEPGFVLPHTILRQESCVRLIGVIGGPIYAPELAAGRAIAAVLATRFDRPLQVARMLTDGTPLRLHRSHDVVGVEVAGAVANVVTLAVGMADALQLGETTRGLLLTRGLVEAATLAGSCGGEPSTLVGLAGVGDLVPRQVGTTSRHRRAGALLAEGASLADAQTGAGGDIDAAVTALAALELAERYGLHLPLVRAVAQVVRAELGAPQALASVLQLDLDPGEALRAGMQ